MPDDVTTEGEEGQQQTDDQQQTQQAQYADKTELDKLQNQVAELTNANQQLTNMMNQNLYQQQQQPQQPAQPQGVSWEEAQNAINEEGDYSKMAKYVQQQNEQTKSELKKEVEELKKYGSQTLGSLAVSQAKNDPNMPHFQRFEKEVMDAFKSTGASDYSTLQNCYTWVIGQHYQDLLKEETEKMKRQEYDTKQQGSLPQHGGKTASGRFQKGGENEMPTPEEYFSEDAQRQLSRKGWTPEQYAQKMGFKNFETLVKTVPKDSSFNQQDSDYEHMLMTGFLPDKSGGK